MAATFEYFPFDNQPSFEAQWRDMMQNIKSDGIIVQGTVMDSANGDCAVSPGTGLQIKIDTGQAWIKGHMFKHTGDPYYINLTSNTSGSARSDLVVLRADFTNNTISYTVITGSTTPVQTLTIWDLPLAVVTVQNNASSIATTDIQDKRVVSSAQGIIPACQQSYSTTQTIAVGTYVNLQWNYNYFNPTQIYTSADLTKFHILESGIYLCEAMIYWKNASTSMNGTVNMYLVRTRSSVEKDVARDTRYFNSQQAVQSLCKILPLLAGDTLHVKVINNTASSLDIDATTGYSPQFSVIKLAPTMT